MKLSVSRVLCAALLLLSGGCRICCPAYDYCSPTNPHGDHSMCCDHGRRGSYFSGDAGYYGEQVIGEESVIENAPQKAPAAPVEQNLQEVIPPTVNPMPPAIPPAVNPAPPPRGSTTSRSRTTVMQPTSRRSR